MISDQSTNQPPASPLWENAESYEHYIGRWSRHVAREFLAWLAIPKRARWLDVGCGTGALVQAILDQATPAEIVGIDPSSAFIAFARANIRDPRVRFEVGDARNLPVASAYDAVVSGLVLNFIPIPDQLRMAKELVRAARVGGAVACYVWDYPGGGMEIISRFWEAAVAFDPNASGNDQREIFPICDPDALKHLFGRAGLSAIETRPLVIPTVFRDFDDYWAPFLGGTGPAPKYLASLPEERRIALRERLRETIPMEADGTIRLTARAWAIRGVR
jgi:ubiquinone/menaquinone biosynthesis C-methylase UbiE